MSINYRLATTVYDRSNATILDIYDLSPPTYVNYTIAGYFKLFDAVWSNTTGDSQGVNSALYGYIFAESGLKSIDNYEELGVGLSNHLKRFMAVPILVSNPNFPGDPITSNRGGGISIGPAAKPTPAAIPTSAARPTPAAKPTPATKPTPAATPPSKAPVPNVGTRNNIDARFCLSKRDASSGMYTGAFAKIEYRVCVTNFYYINIS